MKHRKAAAYHEAGHAVSFCLLWGSVFSAQLFRNWESDTNGVVGNVKYLPNKTCELGYVDWQLGLSMMVSCLAGPYAQARYSKRSFASIMEVNGVGDEAHFLDIANAIGFANCESYETALCVARTIISTNWALVEAVAKGLLQHDRLDSRALSSLILERGVDHNSPLLDIGALWSGAEKRSLRANRSARVRMVISISEVAQ